VAPEADFADAVGAMRTTLRALPLVASAGLLLAGGCGGVESVGGRGSLAPAAGEKGLRVLTVEGRPYEMGWHHGRLLREEIRAVVASPVPGEAAGMYRAYAKGMRPLLPAAVEEELRGLADGAGVSPDDLFLREAARDARRWHDAKAPRLAGSVLTNAGDTLVMAAYAPFDRAAVPPLLVVSRRPTGGTPTVVLAWPGSLGAIAGGSGRGVRAAQAEEGEVAPEQRTLRAMPFAVGFRCALERAADAAGFVAGLEGLVGNQVAVADAAGGTRLGLVRFQGDPPGEAGIVSRRESLFASPGETSVWVSSDGLRVDGVTYAVP
jgi:hypothetical protein